MDAIDRAIVSELFLNCRLPYEELGSKLGLSTSSVWRRVKLLQNEGVIERFYLNLHTDYVWPRTVMAIIDIEDSADEENVVDSVFSNPLVFNVGSIVNGACIADIEVLTREEYDSFEEHIHGIEGVKSIHAYKGVSPPSDRNCVASIPKFTESEKRVITHLMETPRMQIGAISNVTGFSVRKTKKLLGDLTSDNRLWFSLRARTARKGCISFVLKIEMNDQQRNLEVINWIEENIPGYWWSFTSRNAIFTYFIVEDTTNTRRISEKVKIHPTVVSTRSFIRLPYKKRPKIGERMLRKLLEADSSLIE